MALLSRLFSSKKNNKPSCNTNAEKNERSSWKPFAFGKDQVRVLLFRECDWRGRKLLFDSNAVQKVALENSCKLRFASRQKPDKCKKEGFVEVTNGYGYQYTKPSSDAKLLEEMMFGAVAMTFRGTALKVHTMATPNRLMCTKVFPSPVVTHTNRRTSDRSLEDSYGSSVNSMSEYFSQNSGSESLLASGPLDVPMGEIAGPKASRYNSLEGDSGFCGDFSLQSLSSVGSPSYWTPVASPEARSSLGSLCGKKQSGGSLSSLQRRWIRNMSTSLELGLGQTDDVPSCNAQHRRTKLGLAVVVTLTEERTREMEVFLFEHMSIIEAMIERLRFTVERAYLRKETFVHLMHEGWADVQQSVCDMLCSQRLQCPIWLTLTSTENKSHASLASMFLQDLCILISTLDTKATNFFVSTLVTGILTHHLGWVNTVWPANAQTSNTADSTDATDSLSDLLKSHPYNPLWAQLGDLYGALGSPTKIAKTIITTNGRKTDCVNKLLACMTYFIRCGEVKERTSSKQEDDEMLAVLKPTQISDESDSKKCQKNVIPKLFSSRTKSDKVVAADARDVVTPDLRANDVRPEILSAGNSSSTFFVSLHVNNDSGRHQDLSSCTLQGEKNVIPKLFIKCRTKSDKLVADNARDVVTSDLRANDICPEIQSAGKSSSTFFVSLHDNIDSVRHQEGSSSCTLQGDDVDHAREIHCESSQTVSCSLSKNVDVQVRAQNTEIPSAVCRVDVGPSSIVCLCTDCNFLKSNNRRAKCKGMRRASHHAFDSDKSEISLDVLNQTFRPAHSSKSVDPAGRPSHESEFSISIPTEAQTTGVSKTEQPEPMTSSHLEPQDPMTPHDVCFPQSGMSSFYVEDTQKRLNIKLEILSQEMEQFKEGKKFAAHALRGGNFASPAGAEWENENYPTSPTHSGRTSAERESTPEKSGMLYYPNIQTFPGGDERELCDHKVRDESTNFSPNHLENASYSGCNYPSDRTRRLCAGKEEGFTNPGLSKDCGGSTGGNLLYTIDNNGREEAVRNDDKGSVIYIGSGDGSESRTENEDLYHSSSTYGLRSMRRSSRCISQMSDLKSMQDCSSSCSNLYPSIDELAKMENVHLDSEPPCPENFVAHTTCINYTSKGFSSETVESVFDNSCLNTNRKEENLAELITNKVSKLCRVPTMAVMFHLEPEVEETDFKAMPEESFEMKCLNSERQRRAVNDLHLHRSKNASMPLFRDLDIQKASSSEVVFVLGDNEELKGISKHCSRSNSNVDNVLLSSPGCEIGGHDNKTSDLWACASREDIKVLKADLDKSSVITSEPKVVVVKSSYVDLEDESGLLKTEPVNECGAGTDDTENKSNLNVWSALPRSFSVSLPVVKHKRPKKSAKILRRHTEKYCDRCKTILKLKCDKESIPSETNGRRQRSFVSCEKCYCHLRNDTNFGSLGNPDVDWTRLGGSGLKHISRSHDHVDFRLGDEERRDDGGEELESSLEPEADCLREDNAIFEQYDPSDEEILGPQNVEPKVVVPKDVTYSDLHIVDLPLPRCDSRDSEVVGLAASLLGGVSPRYIPDLVLQGCASLQPGWEAGLRRDLTLAAKLPLLGHEVTEAVCVVANTQTWEVQLVSSHAYVVDKPGTFGVCVGMSQLVANMLESLVHLWRLRMPPEHCLLHMESKLRELYLRSQALAELLLTTEFCNMELLTTSLNLEANDVPLLLAVASTHSPQIAHRYGLSFG